MEAITRCSGCMNIKAEGQFCPYCGYDHHTIPENPLFMKPDTTIGHYLFGKVLGHGGFGITYIGYDLQQDKKVAIKEYLPSEWATRNTMSNDVTIYSGDKETSFRSGVEKFKKEAELLKSFNDFPGIVDGYEVFEANHTAYFVMEYIEGITLKEYVEQKGGRLPFETVKAVLMPVIDALAEMHKRDILHRDISPDNIYITKDKLVKLIDFGAARQTDPTKNKGLSVILKHGFTPKEQYFTKGNQGPWTDVYALGATAYYMLSGTVPQPALDRLESDKLVPLTSFMAGIDEKVDYVIRKALAVEELNRFQSVNDFKMALLNPEMVLHQAKAPVQAASYGHTQPLDQAAQQAYQQPPVQNQPVYAQPPVQQVQQEPVKKKKTGLIIAIVLSSIALLVAIGGALTLLLMPKIPDISDMTEEKAVKALEKAGFDYDIQYDTDEKVDAGNVIDQSPESDTRTFKKYVEFTVSKGPEEIKVPDLTGKTEDEAKKELEKYGFEIKSKNGFSVADKGMIFLSEPASGEVVKNGSDITIYISEGPDPDWVVFEDPTLEEAVVSELSLDIDLTKEKITKDMIVDVTELNIAEYSITSLAGLEAFESLETLTANGNKIKTIGTLPANLTSVDLSDNKLTEADFSENKALIELYLDNNSLTKFPTLPSSIQYLSLYSNDIKDISSLTSLTSLYGLDISYNRIEDFTALDSIYSQLGYCYTDGNAVVYEAAGGGTDTTGDFSWADSIVPTSTETSIFYDTYPDEDSGYASFVNYDIPTISAEQDVVYYGPYQMGSDSYELYYFEYEALTLDFYFDPTSQLCTFYDVYGYQYPLFGESDILCQYDTYDYVLSMLGDPSEVIYGESLVFLDYYTPNAVYAFAFTADGTLDFMRVFSPDYYFGN